MGWEIIASGSVQDLGDLTDLVSQTPGGTRCQLQLDLTASPAGWMIQYVQDTLRGAGVQDVVVTSASPQMNIFWTQSGISHGIAIAPLALVAIIIAAIAVIAVTVIGWRYMNLLGGAATPIMIGIGVAAIAVALAFAYREFKGG